VEEGRVHINWMLLICSLMLKICVLEISKVHWPIYNKIAVGASNVTQPNDSFAIHVYCSINISTPSGSSL
jgi:hypothetical protein